MFFCSSLGKVLPSTHSQNTIKQCKVLTSSIVIGCSQTLLLRRCCWCHVPSSESHPGSTGCSMYVSKEVKNLDQHYLEHPLPIVSLELWVLEVQVHIHLHINTHIPITRINRTRTCVLTLSLNDLRAHHVWHSLKHSGVEGDLAASVASSIREEHRSLLRYSSRAPNTRSSEHELRSHFLTKCFRAA